MDLLILNGDLETVKTMSPRPRKATDDQIFAAASRVMYRVGPGELTLGAIAAEAGLTASALVQRFGSRRGLLLEIMAGVARGTPQMFRELRARNRSPLDTLRAYADCMAGMAETPAALARSFAYLQLDLTDEGLRRHLLAQAKSTRAAFRRLLDEAVKTGEIEGSTNTSRLARTIEVVISGSLLSWACYQEVPAARWIRADLQAVLAPYLAPRPRRSSR
jgi:AcrR family transcriptional regulator